METASELRSFEEYMNTRYRGSTYVRNVLWIVQRIIKAYGGDISRVENDRRLSKTTKRAWRSAWRRYQEWIRDYQE